MSHGDPSDDEARPAGDEPEDSTPEASSEPTVSMAPVEVRDPVIDVVGVSAIMCASSAEPGRGVRTNWLPVGLETPSAPLTLYSLAAQCCFCPRWNMGMRCASGTSTHDPSGLSVRNW